MATLNGNGSTTQARGTRAHCMGSVSFFVTGCDPRPRDGAPVAASRCVGAQVLELARDIVLHARALRLAKSGQERADAMGRLFRAVDALDGAS
jgi:hypothetical protein